MNNQQAKKNLFNIAKSYSIGKIIANKKSLALKEIDLIDALTGMRWIK